MSTSFLSHILSFSLFFHHVSFSFLLSLSFTIYTFFTIFRLTRSSLSLSLYTFCTFFLFTIFSLSLSSFIFLFLFLVSCFSFSLSSYLHFFHYFSLDSFSLFLFTLFALFFSLLVALPLFLFLIIVPLSRFFLSPAILSTGYRALLRVTHTPTIVYPIDKQRARSDDKRLYYGTIGHYHCPDGTFSAMSFVPCNRVNSRRNFLRLFQQCKGNLYTKPSSFFRPFSSSPTFVFPLVGNGWISE